MSSATVAVIAAHPDDEVLGCGGTIARLSKEGNAVHVLLMADGETSRCDLSQQNLDLVRTRNEAAIQANRILGTTSVDFHTLPDNRMDELALLDVVKKVEAFIKKYQPMRIITHHRGDVNIDHRVVHEAVITACRPQPKFSVKELLFFEVPSSTEWRPPDSSSIFGPNWFVDVTETFHLKLEALQQYQNELRDFPHPRSVIATKALAQWRGATVGVEAAEAFILGRKLS